MSDVKWIKIVTGIFDDEKIQLIESMPDADAIIVIWLKLLCLAGRTNTNGVLMLNDRIPYTDEMLAAIFRRKDATVKLALKTFEQFGMIEIIGNVITIPNWEKHQNVDRLTEMREYNRLAKQKSRAKQKLLAAVNDKSMTSQTSQDTDKEIDIDKDIETDKEKDKKEKTVKRFSPPALEDVQAYCKERNNNIDAEHFIDYYNANGWKVGKNPMKDWKAAVRTWERNGYSKPKNGNIGANGIALTAERDTELDAIF